MNNDLISRSATVEIMRAKANMAVCTDAQIVFENAARTIEKIPAVDAVEVVRCRDCKWWTGEMLNYFPGYCLNFHKCMDGNWYCASGEMRKAESDA